MCIRDSNISAKIIDGTSPTLIPPEAGFNKEDFDFENVINAILMDSSNFVRKKNVNGIMTCAFFTLNCQHAWYEKFGSLSHIDATFKVNIENYVLYITLCQDNLLRGLPISCCVMRTEEGENMEFMYQSFCEIYDKIHKICSTRLRLKQIRKARHLDFAHAIDLHARFR